MAIYYDKRTWKPVDSAGVSLGYAEKGQADNMDPATWWLGGGGRYEVADGHSYWVDPTGTQVGYGDPNQDYLKNVTGLGVTSKYLTDLFGTGQYGAADAQAALDAYKASVGQKPGDQAENWWDDQARLFAYGTGFDLLGKNTDWQSRFNRQLMDQQQKAYGDYIQGQQAKGGSSEDLGDLMSVLGGVGTVLGAGGLANSLFGVGGIGAGGTAAADLTAGFGSGGVGYGAGSASMGGAAASATGAGGSLASGVGDLWGGELAGLADAVPTAADITSGLTSATGNLLPSAEAVGTGGGTGGETIGDWDFMDLLDGGNGSPLDLLPSGPSPLDVPGGLDAVSPPTTSSVSVSDVLKWPINTVKSVFGLDDAEAKALLSFVGTGIGGIADYFASKERADASRELVDWAKSNSDRAWNATQAYRDRANAALSPGFDVRSIPGLSSAMDTATETYLRKLSAQSGNPAGIGAAPSQTQAFVLGNVGLPALNNYVGQNINAGFGSNLVGPANSNYMMAATNAANADSGVWGSIGQTARNLFGDDDIYSRIGRGLTKGWLG